MRQKLAYKNGMHLSYAEYGDRAGYPLLIQHGLIASIEDAGLFDRLIRINVRLVCTARPGYGASSPYVMDSFAEWADILSVLIEELKLSQFDVLGMSSGAPYSYAIGCKFPKQARNIYIFSGIPALYDRTVLSHWPYKMGKYSRMPEWEQLAHELFFSNLTTEDRRKNDIRDSMMNNGFGVAQDLRLRSLDWGFSLSDVKQRVYMRHSRHDESVPFETAVRTAELLPGCQLELTESGPHFSNQSLDDFLKNTVLRNIKPE